MPCFDSIADRVRTSRDPVVQGRASHLLCNHDRLHVLGIKAIAQLTDACRDLVEGDSFLATIAFHDEHDALLTTRTLAWMRTGRALWERQPDKNDETEGKTGGYQMRLQEREPYSRFLRDEWRGDWPLWGGVRLQAITSWCRGKHPQDSAGEKLPSTLDSCHRHTWPDQAPVWSAGVTRHMKKLTCQSSSAFPISTSTHRSGQEARSRQPSPSWRIGLNAP